MGSSIIQAVKLFIMSKRGKKIIKYVSIIIAGFFLLLFVMMAGLISNMTKNIKDEGNQKIEEEQSSNSGGCTGGSVDGVGIGNFEKNAKGGALEGKGKKMVKIAKKNKIPPKLFMAIVASESQWGKGANATSQKNPLSIMGAGPLRQFSTIEEGLDEGAKNLYDLYISKGLDTPKKIGPKYAPVGASNDPTDLNSNWIPTVSKIMKSFSGKDAKCSTSSSSGDSDGKGFDLKGSKFPKIKGARDYKFNPTYPWGQCTWYVHQRRHQIGKDVPTTLGNGGDWADNAKVHGFATGKTPKAGACASLRPGVLNADAECGHIMFVEKVKKDGGVVVSEANVKGLGVISTRSFSKSEAKQINYIYDKK